MIEFLLCMIVAGQLVQITAKKQARDVDAPILTILIVVAAALLYGLLHLVIWLWDLLCDLAIWLWDLAIRILVLIFCSRVS